MSQVFLAIGSNFKRATSFKTVASEITKIVKIFAVSSLYASKAFGGGKDYLNFVVAGDTKLSFENLKESLKDLERLAGRIPNPNKLCTLDIDILVYDVQRVGERKIHKDLLDKPYVIIPVCDLVDQVGYDNLVNGKGLSYSQCFKQLRKKASGEEVLTYFKYHTSSS